jgi:hypothetical protein
VQPSDDVRRARVGDRVVVRGHHVGEPPRYGEVLEVIRESGAAPYLVRWDLDGHVSRFYASSDAFVEHVDSPRAPRGESSGGG